MTSTVVAERGKKHFFLSVTGFLIFFYLLYIAFVFLLKGQLDTTFFILAAAGVFMLSFGVIHACLAFLMIFRYKSLIENVENCKVLKMLRYKEEPQRLFIVKCAGRILITNQM